MPKYPSLPKIEFITVDESWAYHYRLVITCGNRIFSSEVINPRDMDNIAWPYGYERPGLEQYLENKIKDADPGDYVLNIVKLDWSGETTMIAADVGGNHLDQYGNPLVIYRTKANHLEKVAV